MYIDTQTLVSMAEAVGLGLGLVFAGWMLRGRGEFIKRNLIVNSFVAEMLKQGILDKGKFEEYMKKVNEKAGIKQQ